MQIRLSSFTYLRTFEEESVLFNPRTEAFCVATNVQAVFGLLSRLPKETEDIFESAASALGVSKDAVKQDFGSLLDDLIQGGLAERVDKQEEQSRLYCDSQPSTSGQNSETFDCVFDFYKRHHLPAELHIDLTSACNERCVHCYHADYPNCFLPFETVEKVLQEFRKSQGVTVYLSGGECMLHPEFDQICLLCKSLDLNIIILSNLTACDANRVSLLRDVDPQFINVSLYSMNPAIHDYITRIDGSWRKTMEAFLACERAGVPLRIATPLLKENQSSFKDLNEFANEHKVHLVPDYMIFPKTNHDDRNLCHACSGSELESVLRENKDIFGNNLLVGQEKPMGSKVCRIGDIRLYINAQGNYYPCDGMHGYVLGNAREQSLEQVWNGASLLRLRDLKIDDFDKCKTCGVRKYCMVCPAYNFNSTGDIRKPGLPKCVAAEVVMRVYGKTEEN